MRDDGRLLHLQLVAQAKITPGAIKLKPQQFAGKRAIIVGSGLAGLTTAYELLAQQSGMTVKVLAQMVYENADTLIDEGPDKQVRVEQLRKLMVAFGELAGDRKYQPSAGENALHRRNRVRAGRCCPESRLG